MDHSGNDKRFCVYVHKDQEGNVRYVGSGTLKRAFKMSGRTKKHTDISKYLAVNILYENLSKDESFEKELEVYSQYVTTGLLLNMKVPCKVNLLDYQELSKHFYYDPTSPSGLRWNRPNGAYNRSAFRDKGEIAGSYKKDQYYQVNLFGVRYQNHRIIWCLCNKCDLSSNLHIDHIDRNKDNNNIGNLRLVSPAKNQLNKSMYSNNTSGVKGVIWSNRDKAWIVCWKENMRDKSKYFTVRKLFKEIPFEDAKLECFKLAVEFRKEIEQSIYSGVDFD